MPFHFQQASAACLLGIDYEHVQLAQVDTIVCNFPQGLLPCGKASQHNGDFLAYLHRADTNTTLPDCQEPVGVSIILQSQF